MKYCDLIDRREALEMIRRAAEEERGSMGGQTLCRGLDIAAQILNTAKQHSGWNDPEETSGHIPAGVMILLELTEGEHQSVTRGWWDEYMEEFRTVSRILSRKVVTGWQLMPMPRRERICSGKS